MSYSAATYHPSRNCVFEGPCFRLGKTGLISEVPSGSRFESEQGSPQGMCFRRTIACFQSYRLFNRGEGVAFLLQSSVSQTAALRHKNQIHIPIVKQEMEIICTKVVAKNEGKQNPN
jgi:hypothetical protein